VAAFDVYTKHIFTKPKGNTSLLFAALPPPAAAAQAEQCKGRQATGIVSGTAGGFLAAGTGLTFA